MLAGIVCVPGTQTIPVQLYILYGIGGVEVLLSELTDYIDKWDEEGKISEKSRCSRCTWIISD